MATKATELSTLKLRVDTTELDKALDKALAKAKRLKAELLAVRKLQREVAKG